MRLPALLVVLASLAAVPLLASEASQGRAGEPTRIDVDASQPLVPVPVGTQPSVDLTLQRQLDDRPVPGPGRAEVRLQAPAASGCGPPRQTVELDPTTGRGEAHLACTPEQPGEWPLSVRADAPESRPDTWNATLDVEPDTLHADLGVGPPRAYTLPVNLTLEPDHLDGAPVDIEIAGELDDSPLGFREEPRRLHADGTTHRLETLARHGPGNYTLDVTVTGPLTREWNSQAHVSVPEPPSEASLSVNATVEPGQPRVELTSESVNEDDKTKRPGEDLITRLRTENADEIDVRVLRPTGSEPVAIEETTINASDRVEHVFAHEPLPAGQLWVRVEAGNDSAARTAQIRDLEATAPVTGPETVLADGRAWKANVTVVDPNFGSTPADPGPVFGLPDVSWTVYRGSLVAEGFQVSLGPFEGGAEGTAETSRIPWPQGHETAHVQPGQARLPLAVRPPTDADPGSYRLSLYAPDGDRIGGAEIDVQAPPHPRLAAGEPEPGRAWPLDVGLENPVPNASANVTVLVDGDIVDRVRVSTDNLTGGARPRPSLPESLPAGTEVEAVAYADWPGRPASTVPDARLVRAVPDLPPNVTVHPAVDGAPAQAPLQLHPAAGHELALVHDARDPNGEPVEVQARLEGPDGGPDWPLTENDGRIGLEVPESAAVGRYALVLEADDGNRTATSRVPIEVASSIRLDVDGPEEIRLREDRPERVNLSVRNRGNAAVEAVAVSVQADLAIEARLHNGTAWQASQAPVAFELGPGEENELPVRLEAAETGQSRVNVTVAGVPG